MRITQKINRHWPLQSSVCIYFIQFTTAVSFNKYISKQQSQMFEQSLCERMIYLWSFSQGELPHKI